MEEKFDTITDEVLTVSNDPTHTPAPKPKRNWKKHLKYVLPALLVFSLGLNAFLLASPHSRSGRIETGAQASAEEFRGEGRERGHENGKTREGEKSHENEKTRENQKNRGNEDPGNKG